MYSDTKMLFLNEESKISTRNSIILLYDNKIYRHKNRKDLKTYADNGDILAKPTLAIDSRHNTNETTRTRKVLSNSNFSSNYKQFEMKGNLSFTNINQDKTPKKVAQTSSNPFTTQSKLVKLHVYRYQSGTTEESYCCSCDSEAMFEVMKSLYYCYKKKNCDNCGCIMCGHLSREERQLGEVRKSIASIIETKARKNMAKKTCKALIGKSLKEKEQILKELAIRGAPLPKGKTASEKELIRKIKKEVGLPAEPKTGTEKENLKKAEKAGLIVPLEGRSTAEKEKILEQQIKLAVPLPEGRTASEKVLIQKVKDAAKTSACKAHFKAQTTPLEAKNAAQKEKIFREQAQAGLTLPKGRTPSEKTLIEKIKAEMGAVPSAKAPPGKIPCKKMRQTKKAGLVTPLEGKTPEQKEKILRCLAEKGMPFPEGKTASDNKLIEKVRQEMGLPPGPRTLASKTKYAKAQGDGLITPLQGKNAAQKEKILKAQAEAGLALPEGRTVSEKELIKRIKSGAKAKPCKELGPPLSAECRKLDEKTRQLMKEDKDPGNELICQILSPELHLATRSPPAKTVSEKIRRAKETGLFSPLEEKTPAQKEKIIKDLAKKGKPLPEGTTDSEKKVIEKVRQELGLPPKPKTPASKARYAKAQGDGLITPLEGKNVAQKEKILRAQAQAGLALPEGRTVSEKDLIKKIKLQARVKPYKELGPPLSAEYRKLDEKTRQFMKEGKGPGNYRTLTSEFEKVSIKKQPVTILEKKKKAKAIGLISPLEGKTHLEKETILKCLVQQGLFLPEGKTALEKKFTEKVRHDIGLPPKPTTPCMKAKFAKEQAGGLITPLETKYAAQKEKIHKAQAQDGLLLLEGRTPTEKALINEIRAEMCAVPSIKGPPTNILSKKNRKRREAGLTTPSEDKTPTKKEQILTGLAKHGIHLLEGKTCSEKSFVDKVRREVRFPLQPKSSSFKLRYAKSEADGIITSLEEKSAAEKRKFLRAQAQTDVPLPKGRIISEITLIKKNQSDTRNKPCKELGPALSTEARQLDEKIRKVMKEGKSTCDKFICGILTTESEKVSIKKQPENISEKKKSAKMAGLITPLEGKPQLEKDTILKCLVQQGLPLPKGKTASENKITYKVRHDIGLPPKPTTPCTKAKFAKEPAGGLITPLETKNAAQKEKIHKAQAQAGLLLLEGRTQAEKALINKIRAEVCTVSFGKSPPTKTPAEKIRKAREEDKTPAQKENIPLPEGKTFSYNRLVDKVWRKVGLPLQPKSSVSKMRNAKADGINAPLEEKSAAEKEKNLRAQAKTAVPLSEGTTTLEKKLIMKVRHDMGLPLEPETPTDKLRYAKVQSDGIITLLERKTPCQKNKVLKRMLNAGIPLPEDKKDSEKELIKMVQRAEPTAAVISSEKLCAAKAADLSIALEGKTSEQRKKNIKGLIDESLPVPEGKKASQRALIKSMPVATGLPPEPTSSEKLRGIETKAKKLGVEEIAKKHVKRVGVISQAGIIEEFDDVLKTTCDRGCGCDKKKIRFKHSYVKIWVTSPDISSFCLCPDECISGIKGSVDVDYEGIKVTVGSAVGFPLFTSIEKSDSKSKTALHDTTINPSTGTDYVIEEIFSNVLNINKQNLSEDLTENQNNEREICYRHMINELDGNNNSTISNNDILQSESLRSYMSYNPKNYGSLDSIEGSSFIFGTESSLSFSASFASSGDTIDILSVDSDNIFKSLQYLDYQENSSVARFNHKNSQILSESNEDLSVSKFRENLVIFSNSKKKPIIMLKDVNNSQELMKIVKKILSNQNVNKTPSVIVVASSPSDEMTKYVDKTLSSTICIRMPKNYFNDNDKTVKGNIECARLKSLQYGIKLTTKAKQPVDNVITNKKISSNGVDVRVERLSKTVRVKEEIEQTIPLKQPNKVKAWSQTSLRDTWISPHEHTFSMDTTQDRPCCCEVQRKVKKVRYDETLKIN